MLILFNFFIILLLCNSYNSYLYIPFKGIAYLYPVRSPTLNSNISTGILTPTQLPIVTSKRFSVLCITRHGGTMTDFAMIAKKLDINYQFLNPSAYTTGYGMELTEAQNLRSTGFVHALCQQWDAIVVIDTIPDGRPFYDGSCNKKIILLVTNRFDYGMTNQTDIHEFVQNLNYMRNKKKIHLLVNNPYEIEYMKIRGHDNMTDVPVIRPVGVTDIKLRENIDTTVDAVSLVRLPNFLTDEINGIRIKELNQEYGGPLTLAKYNAVIDVPYQVSVMKMWENLAAGVKIVIPTPRFLDELARKYSIRDIIVAKQDAKLQGHGDKWWKYIEFYRDEWIDCFSQFDSLRDLKRLLKDRDSIHAKREECMARMKLQQQYSIYQWRNMFQKLGIKV